MNNGIEMKNIATSPQKQEENNVLAGVLLTVLRP